MGNIEVIFDWFLTPYIFALVNLTRPAICINVYLLTYRIV